MPQMLAPASGAKIRMYRQGHGDCFLLAFPAMGARKSRPVYVLIDCGLKAKSEVKPANSMDKIIDDIAEATDGLIDVVVVTHEHEDHVNGFVKKRSKRSRPFFDKLEIGALWLAWTEDPNDDLANELRKRFNDTLIGLARAEHRFSVNRADAEDSDLSELLRFETGDDDGGQGLVKTVNELRKSNPLLSARELADLAIKGISNKKAIAYLKGRIGGKPLFLRPDDGPYAVPNTNGVMAFALGPPRDAGLLLSVDPTKSEEFRRGGKSLPASTRGFAIKGENRFFFSALDDDVATNDRSPFSNRYRIKAEQVLGPHPTGPKFKIDPRAEYYKGAYRGLDENDEEQTWREIQDDWLLPSENLAMRLNDEVNNTSLVLAFELPRSGRVLLFTGDAQRGNWISWADLGWKRPNGSSVSCRQLLANTVLYKVGHHGSHNATLNGTPDDPHPNLSWMACGKYRNEFVAMIPANTKWAMGKKRPWKHPLQEIEQALQEKARGAVFRSDIDSIPNSNWRSKKEWKRFKRNIKERELYFECEIQDE